MKPKSFFIFQALNKVHIKCDFYLFYLEADVNNISKVFKVFRFEKKN